MSTPIRPPEQLRPLDYYQIVISFLLVLLGAWILARNLFQTPTLSMGWILGVSFLAFGIYRMKYILEYFRKRVREDKS